MLEEGYEKKLEGKSVLLKVITPEEGKVLDIKLIEAVSSANNRQSKIVEADRRSNAVELIEIQNYIYKNFDLFFERKRGEFEEGIHQKYIKRDQVINRVEFVRSFLAFQGNAAKSRTSQETIFEEDLFIEILSTKNINAMVLAYLAKREITISKFRPGETYAIVAALGECVDGTKLTPTNVITISKEYKLVTKDWNNFITWASKQPQNVKYKSAAKVQDKYFKAEQVDKDIVSFFSSKKYPFSYT